MIWISMFVVIILIYCFYILYRNNRVYFYRNYVLDRIFQQDNWNNLLSSYNKVPYYKMVFIPKPLRDKYWFDEEFINNINKK